MDTKYIIMIAGGATILICIGIYAIYYKMKITKDGSFGKSKLDLYMMELAKKMQKNQNISFILENQIDYYLVKNLRKNVSSVMITSQQVFLFKNFTIIKPNDQIVLAEETKFLEKLSEKLKMKPENFKFIKCYQGELYLDEKKVSMKNYGDLLTLINNYLAVENPDKINILKMKKLNTRKG